MYKWSVLEWKSKPKQTNNLEAQLKKIISIYVVLKSKFSIFIGLIRRLKNK